MIDPSDWYEIQKLYALPAPPPRGDDISGVGKHHGVSSRLPPLRIGRRGRSDLHTLRRRPGVFRRRGIQPRRRSIRAACRRGCARGRICRQSPEDAHYAAGRRQHLTGLVVNQKVAVARNQLELLEAILTNCVRSGPASQNRANVPDFRAHLEGRIGFVEMVRPERARPLRTLFEAVDWSW